jgi:hypothetical protein
MSEGTSEASAAKKRKLGQRICIEFPCLMKSTWEHYGLLQILQTRLFHSARWLGWLSAPQCRTIMVTFYEKLWLLKKITNYWHLKFFLLIAPKRGWHLWMTEHNFIQLINSATHTDRDGGIIDHIYIRGLHSVQSGVLPVYYSDHAAIYSILQ